jgi:acyl-CoA reductase-like NAD-dependent aldehyde dehydrogenase
LISCWNVAPALAAGNTVVLKPSELTPLTALQLGRLVEDAGIPGGVLNVVVGNGERGRQLASHPNVAKVSFTGSTAVGRAIMAEAAPTIKRLTLELGGKAANIVFHDADLETAAALAIPAVFGNAGQDCCSRARILVDRAIYDRFLEALVDAASRWRVGDPFDAETDMGPLISADHRERVRAFLVDTPEPAYQSSAPENDGFWLPATILALPDATARVSREEVFGPVAVVIPFADEDEAVRIANDTPYGLSGSIWTGDAGRALRVARRVHAGALSINSNTSVRISAPFGGVKQSGIGRELGMAGLDAYTEIKNVFISTATVTLPRQPPADQLTSSHTGTPNDIGLK